MKPGDTVELTVQRSGRRQRVTVRVEQVAKRRVQVRLFNDQLVWVNPSRLGTPKR